MKPLKLVLGSIILAALSVPTLPAVAASTAGTTVTCKDGSTANGGKGACRGHGGIDKKATAAANNTASGGDTSPAASSSSAASASDAGANTVTCKDGSSSKGGRCACRGHGGVNKNAGSSSAAAPASAPAASAAAAPAAAPASTATAAPAASSAPAAAATSSGKSDTSAAAGATAKCKDGTYSHSAHHQGSCSNHGGVAKFLDGK